MTLQQRKNAFKSLGEYLLSNDETLSQLINSAQHYNGWFTPAETLRAVQAWGKSLNEDDLDKWLGREAEPPRSLKIGLVLAGNIPLVGFHDILSVLAVGHISVIKLSSQDKVLIPHVLKKLVEIEPAFEDLIQIVERLEGFDAVIATGSNNTSRYFEYYFGKVPHIIRKNRNSVAVLDGTETSEELSLLGYDIFNYFGLGCRNVSKIFVPAGYNFDQFFEAIEQFKPVGNNHKYNNNYDYNKSIFLVNRVDHLDNGFLLLREDKALSSPLAVLFYEQYTDPAQLLQDLNAAAEQIQVLVTKTSFATAIPVAAFGQSQCPQLWDYADGVDTLAFLRGLH